MQSHAIIPAAGKSLRLGGPKLLLPWKGSTIIEHVLGAWADSDVSTITVVARKSDTRLRAISEQVGVELVCPELDTPDMKASVQAGLRFLEGERNPSDQDVWMLAPADIPGMTAKDINDVLESFDPQNPTIVVPYVGNRAGHPVLFPWFVRQQVFQLGDNEGVNGLLNRHPTKRILLSNSGCIEDIDTLQDYHRLLDTDVRHSREQTAQRRRPNGE